MNPENISTEDVIYDGIEGEVQNPGYSSEEDTSDLEGVIELEGDVAVPEPYTEKDGE